MPTAIQVESLGKRYPVGDGYYRYQSLRENLVGGITSRVRSSRAQRHIWALRDVTFSVEEGEVVGVIGRNGAGKTTLLRTIARIVEPTTGVSRTRGRVGTLLDVGTGFHPELTGRENIYLNGSILGMSRRDIRSRFDKIVEFAGVGPYLDTPLKRYSAGMSLRLGFAVAAHLEADIVAVDEVLAVGDAEFQSKCLGKMSDLRGQGRTIVFVSHDMGAVSSLCSRAIWLERGSVRDDGDVRDVIDRYLRDVSTSTTAVEFQVDEAKHAQVLSLSLTDKAGATVEAPRRDQPFDLHVRFVVRRPVPQLDLAFYLLNRQGIRVLDEAWSDVSRPGSADSPGEYEARATIPPILPSGDYVIGFWIGNEFEILFEEDVLHFQLLPSPHDRKEWIARSRIVQLHVDWDVTRCSGPSRP
jgi:ABC-type polysaccharide/polyol phosphate transport system ATPase subunit